MWEKRRNSKNPMQNLHKTWRSHLALICIRFVFPKERPVTFAKTQILCNAWSKIIKNRIHGPSELDVLDEVYALYSQTDGLLPMRCLKFYAILQNNWCSNKINNGIHRPSDLGVIEENTCISKRFQTATRFHRDVNGKIMGRKRGQRPMPEGRYDN